MKRPISITVHPGRLGLRHVEMKCSEAFCFSITFVLIFTVSYIVGDHDDNSENITILSQPRNFEVFPGQTVRLPCEVSPDYVAMEWSKGNLSYALGGIPTGAPINIRLQNNDLIIYNVTSADLGIYVCSSTLPPIKAVVHTIRFKKPPRIVSIHVTDGGIVAEGMNFTITCELTGTPTPTVQWSKVIPGVENVNLTPEMAVLGVNTLTITNVTKYDAGIYICYATNSLGPGVAARTIVKVLGKPRVEVKKQAINSAPNIEVILECVVYEEPPSNIRWYKNEIPLFHDDPKCTINTIEQTSTLRITPRTADQFGVFTCEAENPFGKDRKSIKLVQYPLIDALPPVNSSTFRWRITSHLPVTEIIMQIKEKKTINWQNITFSVPEAKDHIYNVEFVLDSANFDPGSYSAILKAKNTAEWSHSEEVQQVEINFLGDNTVRQAATMLNFLR